MKRRRRLYLGKLSGRGRTDTIQKSKKLAGVRRAQIQIGKVDPLGEKVLCGRMGGVNTPRGRKAGGGLKLLNAKRNLGAIGNRAWSP